MMAEEVRAVLAHGPRTMDEIIDALGVRPRKATMNAYKQTVYLGVREGRLAKDADGRYYVQREVRSAASKGLMTDDEVLGYLQEHGPSTVMEVSAGLGGLHPTVVRRHLARVAGAVGYDGRRIVYALPGETRRRGTERAGADVEGFLRERGPSTVAEVMEGMGLPQQTAWAALCRVAVRLDGKKPYRYALKEAEP